MLGSLARWLRVLGLDVVYDPSLDDAALVRRAVAEQRTILTRDTRLVQRRLARNHLLIRSTSLAEQLHQVCRQFGLRPDPRQMLRRCLRCNQELADLSREQAQGNVPPYVFRTQQRFRSCPACGRIYWRATHVSRMLQRLHSLGLS